MRFQDGKTLVELRVDPSRASIQDVTRARMDRLLVTGQVTVELEGYGPHGRPLPPGAMIEPKADPLHSLTASLPEVVNQAAGVLRRLDAVLAGAELMLDDGNRARLTSMLAHADAAAQRLAEEVVPAVGATLADARAALRSADRTAGAFGDTARAVEAGVASLVRLEQDARALLQESRGVVEGVRGPALSTFAGMRSTLDDLRGLLRQLKLAPDSLLFGVRQPAAPAGGER
jgi:ABC-type transporter Mla subunit MlaD